MSFVKTRPHHGIVMFSLVEVIVNERKMDRETFETSIFNLQDNYQHEYCFKVNLNGRVHSCCFNLWLLIHACAPNGTVWVMKRFPQATTRNSMHQSTFFGVVLCQSMTCSINRTRVCLIKQFVLNTTTQKSYLSPLNQSNESISRTINRFNQYLTLELEWILVVFNLWLVDSCMLS